LCPSVTDEIQRRRREIKSRDALLTLLSHRSPARTKLTTMDTLLTPGDEPPLGAHLITPRRGYFHHGIYVGGGRVVHYTASAFCLIRRPVEEVSLESFSRGEVMWVRPAAPGSYDPAEIIRRARSRLGEDRYRLLTNNCEHFCEWCSRGEHRSAQVEAVRARFMKLWNGLGPTYAN
jgi:Lecithin retinol acyltransferase